MGSATTSLGDSHPPDAVETPRPLIVTLKLDPASFSKLDALRTAHFPPAINHLRAHLTLFHHLPGDRLAQIREGLSRQRPSAPLRLAFGAPRMLGRGVAIGVDAPELVHWRARWAETFKADLTPQDRQPLWPHVTVQNKVSPEQAKALQARLSREITPWVGAGQGLSIWRYLGGPWALETEILFEPASDS